jgi:uncharacterized YigZ family protein
MMPEWVQAFFKCRCLCYNYYKKVSREVLLRERRKQQDMNLTIAKDTRTEQIISKSRFICSLKKVKTEDEAQEFIKAVKKEFWDATHNCSAYVIDEQHQRSSDDGEPSGTAGMPMLGVLRKQNLQQVAAVVTRYFGGIKLGAGGLVRAYAGSVSRAVEEAGLAQKVRMGLYVFSCEPGEAGKITNLLYQQQMFTLTDADYGTRVNFTLRMPDALKGQAEAWLTDALQRQTELTEAGWEFEEVPVKE